MKRIELKTHFGVWEITEVGESTLKFFNLSHNETFTLECSVNFPIYTASILFAFANVHGHKFPNIDQLEIVSYLYKHGLEDWIKTEKINFNFKYTNYISNEVLTSTMYNPYDDDFVFKKYVCYNTTEDDVRVLDGEMKVRYMLLKQTGGYL